MLQKDNIILREILLEDLPEMVRIGNNRKLSINLRDGFPFPYTMESAKYFYENVYKKNEYGIFAIQYEGKYVGNVGIHIGEDVYRKTAEIGYFLSEEHWNKGIMSKVVKMITEYAFNKFDIIKIYAGVFEFNKASQRVLEKCGYKLEAILKKSIIKDEKIWDEYRYAIFKD